MLAEHGIDTARVDARWLFEHVDGDEGRLWPLVERRANREPLAYVLGEWDFRRLTLRCDERALVPRPETEGVVERGVTLASRMSTHAERLRVLDVGTGTGAIALAFADELGADVVATDVSEDALDLARENAERLGLQVAFLRQDIRDGLPVGPFDLVISNPPYVLAEEIDALDPEVRDWEPRGALVDEGQTAALIEGARNVLGPRGYLLIEIHERRAAELAARFEATGYEDVRIGQDLAGRDRMVEGRRG